MTLSHDAITIAAKLITIDSTTGTPGEAEALRYLAGLFGPEFTLTWGKDESALVVAPRVPREVPLLLLSGHVDTVTAITEDWSFDPWIGDIEAGQLRGRGASDMKSGVGAMVAAMLEAGPDAPVALALSTREEWGCAGTPDVVEAIKEAGITVGAILVAEPTDGKLRLGHKGPLWLEVVVRGVSAHGSTPELGENALSKAARLLLRAEEELPLRNHWKLGHETLNVGMLQGGTMRNVVPDRAVLDIDIRTVDPDVAPLLAWWKDQPETSELDIVSQHPAVWTDPDNAWVAALSADPEETPATYGTEAAPLGAALNWPPTVIWGPGPTAVMHTVNETAPVSAIEHAAGAYRDAITAWASLRRP